MRRFQTATLIIGCSVIFVGLFLAYRPLAATNGVTFVVNNTADAVDVSPGDGTCETANGNGICTLRAAVQETNTLPGPDTIQIPSGIYTLTLPGIDTSAAVGDLDILDDLTIVGAGADQTIIDGNQLDRVIHVVCADSAYPVVEQKGQGICPTDITVSISQVTIRNGLDQVGTGSGGIFNSATLILDNVIIRDNSLITQEAPSTTGGGIVNFGVLTMTHSIVTNNTVQPIGNGAGLGLGIVQALGLASETYIADSQITGNIGHGITSYFNSVMPLGANLTIERSVVSNNSRSGIDHHGDMLRIIESEIVDNTLAGVDVDHPDASFNLFVEISNSLISGNSLSGLQIGYKDTTISNSTISNNSSSDNGGGILVGDLSRLTLINTTIVQNSAVLGGGIFARSSATGNGVGNGSISNSIIAQNSGGNCDGVMFSHSAGNNIEDGADCNFTMPGDMQNIDPMLAPLQNNGGSTNTHALLPGSPAADAANDAICQSSPVNSLDQRPYSRVNQDGNLDGGADGDPCDIGAFEISAAPTSVQLNGDLRGSTKSTLPFILSGISLISLICLIGWRYLVQKKTR